MELINKNGVPLLQFNLFKRFPEIVHAVSTRLGGYSAGPYESLNLGFKVGDVPEDVFENRRKVVSALGSSLESLVTAHQAHTSIVRLVTGAPARNGALEAGAGLTQADGFVTAEEGLVLMIKIADCFSVFLYDPKHSAVGLLHAGWRGVAKGIVSQGVEAMITAFGSDRKNLVAGIGPGINRCCFEVREEVLDAFAAMRVFSDHLWEKAEEDTYYFDLKQAILMILLACGLDGNNIEVAAECTSCYRELLFSHRRDNGRTGRMAALLGLKG